MNINKATIVGRLVRDPEMKALPNGTKVVNISIATSRTWKDANGAKQESVEFHNAVAFAKIAEVIGQYLKKGQLIGVIGRLQTRSWDDKDSAKKMYRTEVVIEEMQMGPKAAGTTAPGGSTTGSTGEKKPDTIEYPEQDINPEDIPF